VKPEPLPQEPQPEPDLDPTFKLHPHGVVPYLLGGVRYIEEQTVKEDGYGTVPR
jgi:hypothetical protein